MAEEDLTYQQLKNLLQDTLQIFQNSGSNLRKDDYSILESVIRNIDFFHTNLEAPANLHDFSQMIKYHLNYEVHSQGTALMKEGEYANKFYVLLKGAVQKLKPRTFEDLEQEVQEQSPRRRNKMKKQMTNEPEEFMHSQVKKDIPRYLQHTVATQKKTAVVKPDFYTSPLNETAETKSDVKPKLLRLKSTLDVPKRASMRKSSFEPSTDEVASDNQQGFISSNNSFISSNQSYLVMNVKDGSRSPSPEQQQSILNKVNGSSQPSVQELSEGEESEDNEDNEDEDNEDSEDDDTNLQTEKRKKARLLKNGMTQDDVNFIKLVAKQNPDIENRCFLGEIIRVKKDRTLKIGGYFGENFFRRNRPKEECIMAVASEEAHFLILTRENYELVMAEICKQSQEKAKFFLDLFPFYDELIVKKFSYHFSEREFKKNDAIFQQGTPASELYLLRNGDVRLFKEVEASPQDIEQNLSNSILVNLKCSGKIGLPIATVMKNQFFGDELFLKQDIRQYTALAIGSSTSTYFLKARAYHKIKSYFSDLLQILKDHTKERFIHRELRVKELLDRKKQTTEKSLSKKWSQDRMSTDALKAHLGVRWGKDDDDEKKKKVNAELRLGYKSPDSNQNSQTDLKSSRILHTERTLATESSVPVPVTTTLGVDRIDFSRKARIVDNLLDGQYIRRRVEDSIKESSRSPPRHNIEDFNMVKELHPKNNKVRLPSLQSSRSPSPQKVLYTERSGVTKPTDPDVTNSPVIKRFNSKRSQSIETLVTDYIYDEVEEDGPRRERKLNKESSRSISKVINLEELRNISKKSAYSLTAKTDMNNKIRRCVQTIVNTNKILRANGPTCLKLAIQGKRKMVEEMSNSDSMKLSAVFGKKSELQIKGQK